MADARNTAVWTKHAEEQWETNRFPHKFNDDFTLRKWLLEHTGDVSKVLDFGCGGGLWHELFAGFDYHGFDQNENMVVHACKRFPEDVPRFVCGAWNKLPYDSGSFDLVFTAAVLQHNKHQDKKELLPEIVRVIRPGGYFMCTENTFREDNYRHTFPWKPSWEAGLDDGYSFTSRGWEKFMAEFGLTLLAFEFPGEYLYQKAA